MREERQRYVCLLTTVCIDQFFSCYIVLLSISITSPSSLSLTKTVQSHLGSYNN